jgi:hypothetical protein
MQRWETDVEYAAHRVQQALEAEDDPDWPDVWILVRYVLSEEEGR